MNIINFTDIVSLVSAICRYSIAQLIIRLHLTTMLMQPIVTDGAAWSVGWSVTMLSMQTWLNQSRCRLGREHGRAQGTMH